MMEHPSSFPQTERSQEYVTAVAKTWGSPGPVRQVSQVSLTQGQIPAPPSSKDEGTFPVPCNPGKVNGREMPAI